MASAVPATGAETGIGWGVSDSSSSYNFLLAFKYNLTALEQAYIKSRPLIDLNYDLMQNWSLDPKLDIVGLKQVVYSYDCTCFNWVWVLEQ